MDERKLDETTYQLQYLIQSQEASIRASIIETDAAFNRFQEGITCSGIPSEQFTDEAMRLYELCVSYFTVQRLFQSCREFESEVGRARYDPLQLYAVTSADSCSKSRSGFLHRVLAHLARSSFVPIADFSAANGQNGVDMVGRLMKSAPELMQTYGIPISDIKEVKRFIAALMKCVFPDTENVQDTKTNISPTLEDFAWIPSLRCIIGFVELAEADAVEEYSHSLDHEASLLCAQAEDMTICVGYWLPASSDLEACRDFCANHTWPVNWVGVPIWCCRENKYDEPTPYLRVK